MKSCCWIWEYVTYDLIITYLKFSVHAQFFVDSKVRYAMIEIWCRENLLFNSWSKCIRIQTFTYIIISWWWFTYYLWFNIYRLYNNNDRLQAFFISVWNPINEQKLLPHKLFVHSKSLKLKHTFMPFFYIIITSQKS